MKYRHVGRTGLVVSRVCLGAMTFDQRDWGCDEATARAIVHAFVGAGGNFIDTADGYSGGRSEEVLGRVLKDFDRDDIVLATKAYFRTGPTANARGLSRKHLMEACEASLRRLQTDYIDLYQIHGPDPRTPIEETLRTLDDLTRQGKIRYAGCSNFPAWKVVESIWTSKQCGINAFVSCQDEYSLLVRNAEWELIPAMQGYGLGLLPYFPLSAGMLTGKYSRMESPAEGTRFSVWKALVPRYFTERNWNIVECLEKFCAERKHTLLELAFNWLLANPVVSSVIAGATKPEQVEMNVAAADWSLSPEDLAEIEKCFL